MSSIAELLFICLVDEVSALTKKSKAELSIVLQSLSRESYPPIQHSISERQSWK